MKKRRPGRPVGEFGQRGSVMGIRMPEDLRRRLQLAAQESGRSLTGELLFRVELTFRGHEEGMSLAEVVDDWQKTAARATDALRQFAYVLKEQKKRRKQ